MNFRWPAAAVVGACGWVIACGHGTGPGMTETKTSAADCATLVPATPASPMVWTSGFLTSEYGSAGTSDGSGNLLFIVHGTFTSQGLICVAPDGSSQATATSFNWDRVPLASGFVGVQTSPVSAVFRLLRLDPDGTMSVTEWQNGSALQAKAPRGLMVYNQATQELQAWDEKAHLRWDILLDRVLPNARALAVSLGVDSAGNTLLLYDSDEEFGPRSLGGVWVDPSGRPGVTFQAAGNVNTSDDFKLYPQVGKGFFLEEVGCSHGCPAWLAAYDPHVQGPSSPPPWLVARPATRVNLIRQGTGYGLTHKATNAFHQAECSIEVLSADGTLCEMMHFDPGSRGCSTIEIGQDGTLIAQPMLWIDDDCRSETDGACRWTWHWWPALFH
jgi:hypothetical protein